MVWIMITTALGFNIFGISLLLGEVFVTVSARILLLHDENSEAWIRGFREGLSAYQQTNGNSADFIPVMYKNESDWERVCQTVSNVTIVLDLTRKIMDPETQPQKFFTSKQIPYYRVDLPFDTLLRGVDSLLQAKNGSNGFLIFHSDLAVNRGINVVLGSTLVRYSFLNYPVQKELILEKFDYRVPSGVALFGTDGQFRDFIRDNPSVVRNRMEWLFMYDEVQATPSALNISFPYFRGFFPQELCCSLRNPTSDSQACSPFSCRGVPTELFLSRLAYLMSQVLQEVDPASSKSVRLSCSDANNRATGDAAFNSALLTALRTRPGNPFTVEEGKISFSSSLRFEEVENGTASHVGDFAVGTEFALDPNFQFRTRKRYFRVGIVNHPPWTMKDEKTGQWTGYCIDLAKGISEQMDFEYDLVLSNDFGRRLPPNGRWDGLTGDIVHGKVDIAVAPFIMTSEREEFIDFVSPYYEQSGLIISKYYAPQPQLFIIRMTMQMVALIWNLIWFTAMQRPVVKNSLFKFMTVLRTEVWLSILGATIATGFMLWFLDKFSPYSAQNNPHKYKNFRKFTLKESFWFALTSFTPQGGGEPPKAFSGRTLVAAYWIFVVLMLATFTANLAAFLTVERMQTAIRNLEHLAQQSSVKYSVVNVSTAMTFFKNMANAEETLYQMWRNLTLTAPSSAREYVVWEYPIREMYIHIHSVIQKTGTVTDMNSGFQKVMEDEYYAFIHDAAQTRYEVFRNCNLTLIGEPFAEAPYAIAVAQGNPLQDDISMAILQLQTERFFETLSARYWTSTCPSLGDGENDGISLESLGGVFIATIIGLGIAFISLAIEVFTTARNRRKAKIAEENMIRPKFIGPMDFYGTSKGIVSMGMGQKMQSHNKTQVLKRTQFLPEVIN